MAEEQAIIIGLGVITAMFGWYSFKLSESDIELNKKLGLYLAFVSLLMVNLIMYAVLKVAEQNATYLLGSVVLSGFRLVMWSTIGIIMLFGLALLFGVLQWIVEWAKSFGKRKGGGGDD